MREPPVHVRSEAEDRCLRHDQTPHLGLRARPNGAPLHTRTLPTPTDAKTPTWPTDYTATPPRAEWGGGACGPVSIDGVQARTYGPAQPWPRGRVARSEPEYRKVMSVGKLD